MPIFNLFFRRIVLLDLFLLTVLSFLGCANLTYVNKPLHHWDADYQEKIKGQISTARSSEYLVLLAFSGGGTRAAAFAYGALRELNNIQVQTANGPRSLLSEVDVISSVSGGSFTSAYYGLRGEKIFDDFERKFLRQDVEGKLMLEMFNPINWFRLMSATFGRTDIAAKYYDQILFENATFADLYRPGSPLVVINSTDLATGLQFSFDQSLFSLICSDYAEYPISRAVAASSAVPLLFSPITLKSYAGDCGYQPPEWLTQSTGTADTLRANEIRALQGYLNKADRPWLHLVDGGIADNLGLRPFFNYVNDVGSASTAFSTLKSSNVRNILIISVNARAIPPAHWSLEQDAPALTEVINSISSDQIDLYSADTVQLVRDAYHSWAQTLVAPGHPVTFNMVEVTFDKVKEKKERDYLNEIGTNFDLSNEQVDALISSAGKVLHDSSELQSFLAAAGTK